MIPDEQAQAELDAERQADTAERLFSETFYRNDFDGPSLGTEEELTGATIRMQMTASRLIGVVAKDGNPLVLITRDMRIRQLDASYREYTIELRTTPTEIANLSAAGWEDRRRALQVAIWAIDARKNYPLESEVWRGFRTIIRNSDHTFIKQSETGVTGSDKQATFGVPAAEIVVASQLDRAGGRLHPHVQVPWYQDQFTADHAAAWLTATEQVAYAFLMSAALMLTRLPRHDGQVRLYTPGVKNAWGVRPRTPPIRILDAFPAGGQDAIRHAFTTSTAPTTASPQDWATYTGWIIDGRSLGGHTLPDTTINGAPAMLFEYRTAPHTQYPYAFWQPGEWQSGTF